MSVVLLTMYQEICQVCQPLKRKVGAIEAVESAYSYDFVNYRSRLQDATKSTLWITVGEIIWMA